MHWTNDAPKRVSEQKTQKDCLERTCTVEDHSPGCNRLKALIGLPWMRIRRDWMEECEKLQFESYILVLGLVFISIFVSVQADSKPGAGFVSIDCGGSPSSNAITTISWEGDSWYTSTGSNGHTVVPADSSVVNADALGTFRYFPGSRSKYCYDLPTAGGNVSFLLRAMFYHGYSTELTLPIQFDVAVNGTPWFTVDYPVDSSQTVLTTPVKYEGIFFAAGTVTHFCLVTRTGSPFISSLELRPLDRDGNMYFFNTTFGANGVYLSTLWRVNCGAPQSSANVRYPGDMYDRIWYSPGDWATNLTLFDANGVVNSATSSNVNAVPPEVMQTAWLSDLPKTTFSLTFSDFGPAVRQVYVALYFEGLEAGDQNRIVVVYVNGDLTLIPVSSRSDPLVLYYYDLLVPDSMVNFSFGATTTSLKGPVVNAVELYAILNFNFSATAPKDVDTILALQVSLNMTDWQGDPCYPVPLDWVGCSSQTPARVQRLLLSNMGIRAEIPPIISNLDALTAIHLDNNSFFGTIPDSLANLSNLAYLFVNNNDLSGPVPSALVSKLGSNFDYAGNSLLGTSSTKSSSKKTSIGLIISVVAGVLALGAVVGLLACYCRFLRTKKRQSSISKNEIAIGEKHESLELSGMRSQLKSADLDKSESRPSLVNPAQIGRVSYNTVKTATNDFAVELGKGSYGSVYHGWLDGKEVAVKLNDVQSDQGLNEFSTEIEILTRVHHRNLVSLIGYCDEGKSLILIYEYQRNGTLRQWLQGGGKSQNPLDWKQRLQIAADAARGLEYLHKGCNPPIIHRDVKSSNILLDSNMSAKVADFGISKAATPGDDTRGYSTNVKGTRGYLDPEYHHLGRLTFKSDVYSFGVVLAEIITGLPPVSAHPDGKSVLVLVDQVKKMAERNDIEGMADPTLRGLYYPESIWRMADVALACVEPAASMRPDFTEVVDGINEAIELGKVFHVHSPLVTHSRSFSLRSTSSHGYQNLP